MPHLPPTPRRLLTLLLQWKLLQRRLHLQLMLQLLLPRMPHLLLMLLQVLIGGVWVWVCFVWFVGSPPSSCGYVYVCVTCVCVYIYAAAETVSHCLVSFWLVSLVGPFLPGSPATISATGCRRPIGFLILKGHFTQKSPRLVALLRKLTCNLRHPMCLCHPVPCL